MTLCVASRVAVRKHGGPVLRGLPAGITLVLLLATSGLPADSGFRVGAAKREITPREPVPMWGYADRHDRLSQGILDPLHADALVIQAGGRKLAIVGLDLGRSPAEHSLQNIRKRILEEAGIEHSLIAGSHSHHTPVLELTDEEGKGKGRFDAALRYYRQLEDGIVGAVLDANARLVPARVASGSATLDDFNRNRHTKLEPKPRDRELAVLRFDDLAGKPVAIVVNFAAHPTMIPSSTLEFSADYAGSLKRTIEKETSAAVIFLQGAAGDLATNRGPYKDYREFGEALGREALELAKGLTPEEVAQPELQVREERFRYPSRTDFTNPLLRAAFAQAFFPELIPNYVDEYADGIRPRLTVVLLNRELAFVGVSGEFFSAHANRLRERARTRQLYFVGYCNGYHQYFPTIEAVAEGGYGADSTVSPVAVGAGEEIMNTALIWLYRMLGNVR